MQKDIEITLAPEIVESEPAIRKKLSNALNIDAKRINSYQILKRSIDARSRNVIYKA
ncbi:hypothetical protein [Pedobacter sp. MC2016-24]|uniref:hypothetical protein n=1 Tax=Pedobacter sp. MC2016-24 TaxID=2780090 RepID=UPI00187EB8C5|nr:hypothetical protein [Pedobacter sp. MC2016-24]MBE9602789.1 hypothetical protein [Pedobacter sp. MC2016-24]